MQGLANLIVRMICFQLVRSKTDIQLNANVDTGFNGIIKRCSAKKNAPPLILLILTMNAIKIFQLFMMPRPVLAKNATVRAKPVLALNELIVVHAINKVHGYSVLS